MQPVDFPHPIQHFLAELQAVVDGRGLDQIEHSVVEITVAALADAADLVRGVLRLRQELGRRAGGALGGQREHRRTARGAAGEGVGVNRNEQIRALLARLGDAHLERDKHVFVARHEHFHVRLALDHGAQLAGNLQHNVFLARLVLADSAGIFAAVAGIQHDDDRPIAPRLAGLRRFRRQRALQIALVVIFQ